MEEIYRVRLAKDGECFSRPKLELELGFEKAETVCKAGFENDRKKYYSLLLDVAKTKQ